MSQTIRSLDAFACQPGHLTAAPRFPRTTARLSPLARILQPRPVAPESDGNVVVGCLFGGAIAMTLWTALATTLWAAGL